MRIILFVADQMARWEDSTEDEIPLLAFGKKWNLEGEYPCVYVKGFNTMVSTMSFYNGLRVYPTYENQDY